MAISKPYDANDVFSSPEEARRGDAYVTAVPRDAFRESLSQPEVRAMVEAARRLPLLSEPELPQSLS
jgi:hypothetical protein